PAGGGEREGRPWGLGWAPPWSAASHAALRRCLARSADRLRIPGVPTSSRPPVGVVRGGHVFRMTRKRGALASGRSPGHSGCGRSVLGARAGELELPRGGCHEPRKKDVADDRL